MGSYIRPPFVTVLVAVSLLGAPLAVAQDEGPSPEELFTFESEGGAAVNDIAITAEGGAGAAVLDDPGLGSDAGTVCPWNLEQSPESSDTKWPECGAPQGNVLDSDTSVDDVAVHQRGDSPVHIAVGDRGDSGSNEIYVYDLGAGSGSDSQAGYPEGTDPPEGAVQDLVFLDASTILAWHAGELSLLDHDEGTQYIETDEGRWSPDAGTLQDVAVSGNGDRIVAAVSEDPTPGDPEIRLIPLGDRDGNLTSIGDTKTITNKGTGSHVALDQAGTHLVLGTDDRWVFYAQLTEKDSGSGLAFSPSPYSTQVGDPVVGVGIGANGERFAVGDSGSELTLFRQTVVEDSGPRADAEGSIGLGGQPSEIDFAQNGKQVYVSANSLFAFHARQFETEDDVRPLWVLDGVNAADFTDSGQRFLTSDGSVVSHYGHAYEAEVTVDGPEVVDPGEQVSLDVSVRNVGSLFDTYRLKVSDVPGQWSVDWNRSQVPLLPGSQGEATVNLTPNNRQAPGDVTVTVEAQSGASPDGVVAGDAEHTLTVNEIRRAAISVDDTERSVDLGETVALAPVVTNDGNLDATITMTVDPADDWPVRIDGTSGNTADVDLTPGASNTYDVELDVPAEGEEGSETEVTLSASPTEGGSSQEVTVSLILSPSYSATLSAPTDPVDAEPGDQATFDVGIQNSGNIDETFSLRAFSNATNPDHLWRVNLDTTSVEVRDGGSGTVEASVDVPRNAERGESTEVTVVARSAATDEKVDEVTATVQIPEDTEDSPMGLLVVPLAVGLAALARRDR